MRLRKAPLLNIVFLLWCVLLLGSCAKKKETVEKTDNQLKLPRFGVSFTLPDGFVPLTGEELSQIEQSPATSLQVEPFTVSLLQGFKEQNGKATLTISALEFSSPAAKSDNPMSNIYEYQKSLEAYFGVEEISSEEIEGKEISILLMAMIFEEDGEDYALIKGLCYKYPEHFFVIDLYARQSLVTLQDAQNYRNMFLSLNIY
jgi:hypothetical protein